MVKYSAILRHYKHYVISQNTRIIVHSSFVSYGKLMHNDIQTFYTLIFVVIN